MKRNTILTAAALFMAALFILDVPAADAATKYFRPASSPANWNAANVWYDARTGGNVVSTPANGDHAIILTEKHCDVNITTARADSFAVEGSGVLDINTGQQLEIDSASSVVGSAGVIIVGTGTLKISASLTISGAGSIDGQDNAARIDIGANVTLTITTMTIEGNLLITEPAAGAVNTKFVNNGHVKANNGSGKLELSMDSLEVSSGSWWCSASSAFLKLNYGSSAGTHSGKFTILEGTLDVVKSCTTSGDLEVQEGGQVNVAAGETFTGCN